jgi:thiamine biosynthesis lipoprotein
MEVSTLMIKHKKSIVNIMIGLSISMTILFSGCSKKETGPISKTEILLDTPCTITIYDKVSNDVLQKGFDKLKEIDTRMNANTDNSEIALINKSAGSAYAKVSDETFYVIEEGKKYGDITKGKFDITVGPLVKLWGINTDHARVPSESEIKEKLNLINYNDVLLKESTKEVMLKNINMSLDLGGIAKGYAGDAVAKVLKDNGVKHALIDLGGNIMTVGNKVDGSNWRIGVQNPNSERGESLGVVEVADKAVVTSGIYERFFIQDGKKYHHILDTKTGYPVDSNLASVSIIADKSIDGDAYAKAFTLGLEKGIEFIESQPGVQAIFVTKDSKVYITSGLKDNFKITDENFKLMN